MSCLFMSFLICEAYSGALGEVLRPPEASETLLKCSWKRLDASWCALGAICRPLGILSELLAMLLEPSEGLLECRRDET